MGTHSLIARSSGFIDNTRIKNFAQRDVDDLNLAHVFDVLRHVSGLIHRAVLSRDFWGEKNPTQCRLKSVNRLQNVLNLATNSPNSWIVLFVSLPTKLHELVRKRLNTSRFREWNRILRACIYDVARYHYKPSRAKSLLGWDDLANFENGLAWKIDLIGHAHSLELLQATER